MIVDCVHGNLLNAKCGVIGHGVNCQGVMGSGVAKQVRAAYPEVFTLYCKFLQEHITPYTGTTQLIHINPRLFVANMFTQIYYGSDGQKYAQESMIANAMKSLVTQMREVEWEWESDYHIHLPEIGCGLGGLQWDVVANIIDEHSADVPVTIYSLEK